MFDVYSGYSNDKKQKSLVFTLKHSEKKTKANVALAIHEWRFQCISMDNICVASDFDSVKFEWKVMITDDSVTNNQRPMFAVIVFIFIFLLFFANSC